MMTFESGSSSITEAAGGAITTAPSTPGTLTGQTLTFRTDDRGPFTVSFGSPNNNFGSSTVVIQGAAGGTEGDFGFGSSDADASLNQVTFSNFTIDALTLVLSNPADNVDVGDLYSGTLPLSSGVQNDYTSLSVTAGGNIVDGTALTALGVAFTVLGTNSSITAQPADGTSNNIGEFSFVTPANDSGNVSCSNGGAVVLGNCSLGTGEFNVTAGGNGNITEAAGDSTIQAELLGQPSATSATFTVDDGTSIDLSQGNQNFFTGPLTFDSIGNDLATISVEDANPAATVASFVAAVPTSDPSFTNLNLIFDGPVSSVSVAVPESLAFSLSVTATNNIILPAGSALTVDGNHHLVLRSRSKGIILTGVVTVGGTTTLTTGPDGAGNIIANNDANSFGTLSVNSDASAPSITIVSAGALTLDTSDVATEGGSMSLNALTGDITQASTTTSDTFSGIQCFVGTPNGSISLTSNNNEFDGTVSAVVSGANTIAITDSVEITLGTISLDTGSLTITAAGVTEDSSGNFNGVSTAPTSSATIAAILARTNVDPAVVDLSEEPNNIPSTVTLSIDGDGETGNFGFRNVNPTATMSQVEFSDFTVQNLTVDFATSSVPAALDVSLGSDYLQTQPGTSFNFGAGIGVVNFTGLPIGPGLTDTIVQRQQNALWLPGAPRRPSPFNWWPCRWRARLR